MISDWCIPSDTMLRQTRNFKEDNISTIGHIMSRRIVSVSIQKHFKKFVYKCNLCRKLTYEVRHPLERNSVANLLITNHELSELCIRKLHR